MILFAPSVALSWQHTYEFTFKNNPYSVTLTYDDSYIDDCVYNINQWNQSDGAKSTFYNKDISKYIEESPCKKVIKDLHCKIEAQYKKINQPELWDDINFRIAFVGSAIQYSDDLETNGKQEFFQTPFQTIYSRKGDCEDTSFLLSMLFSFQGYNSILIQTTDHQAVCVDPFSRVLWMAKTDSIMESMKHYDFVRYSEGDYYYCESTNPKDGNCYVMGQWPDFAKGKLELIEFVGLYHVQDNAMTQEEYVEFKKQLRKNGGIPLLIGNR